MQTPTARDASPMRVRVREDIEVVPEADGDRLIAIDPRSGRQVRLSPLAAQLLAKLDGSRSSTELARELGGLDPSSVYDAVGRLRDLALVEDHQAGGGALEAKSPGRLSSRAAEFATLLRFFRPRRRWRYRPPATIELTLIDPRRALKWLRPASDLVASRCGQALLWLVTVGGLAVAIATRAQVATDLARPARWWVALVAFGTVVLSTGVHEFAHGLALTRAGGRVRRMGVMLLYGSPALFCDVSEAWRLSRRRRITVALAGARAHAAIGGILILVAALTTAGDTRQLLTVAAVGNAVMAIVNLYPFVKFDGYVALVGWLDQPHLRAHSMQAAKALLITRVVFGGRSRPATRQPTSSGIGAGWILFGILSAVSAPALIVVAFRSYGPVLVMVLGPIGAAALLALLGVSVALPTRAVVAAAHDAALSGAPRWRRLAGGALLSIAFGLALAFPRLPLSATTVYQQTASGTLLVVPDGVELPEGAAVSLRIPGVVLQSVVGKGVVCGSEHTARVDRGAGSPILATPGTSSPSTVRSVVSMCATATPTGAGRSGIAFVSLGRVPLGTWLYRTLVEPALSRLT